jgi:hypothetical protein
MNVFLYPRLLIRHFASLMRNKMHIPLPKAVKLSAFGQFIGEWIHLIVRIKNQVFDAIFRLHISNLVGKHHLI